MKQKLLKDPGKSIMSLTWYRCFCIEIYNSLKSRYPSFMKDWFNLTKTTRLTCKAKKMNLDIPRTNKVTYGTNNLTSLVPKICNRFCFRINTSENRQVFCKIIKNWKGILAGPYPDQITSRKRVGSQNLKDRNEEIKFSKSDNNC